MKSQAGRPPRHDTKPADAQRGSVTRRIFVGAGLSMLSCPAIAQQGIAADAQKPTTFKRVQTQYIAVLSAPEDTSGDNAQTWAWWYKDPGPRGVWAHRYEDLMAAGGQAPARWKFDDGDWWLDENGVLMEKPQFAIQPGKFVVTGNREAVAVLTIHPRDSDGRMRWELGNDATLYDVTHLECRAARYRPVTHGAVCSPKAVSRSTFPVKPGQPMPDVQGCSKKDYTVLFVIGVATTNS